EVLKERFGFTVLLSVTSMAFVWVVAIPIGMYSAIKRYSPADYTFTFIGFLGLAVPNFLIALVLMFISYRYFGQSVGALFSPEFADSSWNLGKLLDLLSNLWLPIVIIEIGRAHV